MSTNDYFTCDNCYCKSTIKSSMIEYSGGYVCEDCVIRMFEIPKHWNYVEDWFWTKNKYDKDHLRNRKSFEKNAKKTLPRPSREYYERKQEQFFKVWGT